MFELTNFIDNCLTQLDSEDPVAGIEGLAAEAMEEPQALRNALPDSEFDESLVHACDRMTVVILRLTPNIHYPPHNHFMPVVIGAYEGQGTSIGYREEDGGLVRTEELSFSAPEVAIVPRAAIHSVVNLGDTRSGELHIYLGDLVNQERTIWDPVTFERHPYSDEKYFELATPFDSEKQFVRPKVPAVHDRHHDVRIA